MPERTTSAPADKAGAYSDSAQGERLAARVTAAVASLESDGVDAPTAVTLVWQAIAGVVVEELLDPDVRERWFGLSDLAADVVRANFDDAPRDPWALIQAFEATATLRNGVAARRDAGAYYTPRDLAEFSVGQVIKRLHGAGRSPHEWRILDPAGGAGAFVLAAGMALVEERRGDAADSDEVARAVLAESLHMVDADPLAVAVARVVAMLAFAAQPRHVAILERRFVHGDALLGGPLASGKRMLAGGVNWRATFGDGPEWSGFSAVIGNPPWGTVKPALREFAAQRDPSALKLDGRALRERYAGTGDGSAAEQAAERRSYARAIGSAGFAYQGRGDVELYRYFVELGHSLLDEDGILGLLVPSALQRAAGAGPLRALLFNTGTVRLWIDFVNTQGIFAIHRMFRFALVVWARGAQCGVEHYMSGVTSVQEATNRLEGTRTRLSSAEIAAGSPRNSIIPDVRSSQEAELYSRLHGEHPRLGDVGAGPWAVKFRRELDMTNDLNVFHALEDVEPTGAYVRDDHSWFHPDLGVLLPVYEGRMVNQFDSAAKTYVEGHGRSARWAIPGDRGVLGGAVRPRYFVEESTARARGVNLAVRAGFCDITGHANERTILASVIPARAVCGNKVPTCEFTGPDAGAPMVWTAVANSFVVDWIARRRVSTTLNFFHLEELPFPRISSESEDGQVLAQATTDLVQASLGGIRLDGPAVGQLRTRIDVVVARAFGVDLDDIALMMADFGALDRAWPSDHRGVTRDAILDAYAIVLGRSGARLTELGIDPGRGPARLDERMAWHRAEGAFPYRRGSAGR